MPKLKRKGLDINFKIIGQASKLLRFSLTRFRNVSVHNNIKKPESLCKNAICGISNLNIVSGIQNKILEYMRIGLPAIISEKCFEGLNLKKNKHLLVYKNHDEFVNQIIQLRTKSKFANKISHNCFIKINKSYTWKKTLNKYNSII